MTSSLKRVLVVEGTAVTRFSVRQTLEEHGYEAEEAASGEEALTKVAAHPEPFNLIILDIVLPGMDGLAVLRELKAQPKSKYTPVMVLSASSSLAVVRQALDLGAVEYLIKPFAPEELVRRVEKLIGPGRKTPGGPLENLFGILQLEVNRTSRARGVFSLLLGRRLGTGSRPISELEAHIRRRLRDIDTVLGLEAGNLAVVLPVTGAAGAEVVKGKLAEGLSALEPEAKWEFGLAVYPENGSDPGALYRHAQAALANRGQPRSEAAARENPSGPPSGASPAG